MFTSLVNGEAGVMGSTKGPRDTEEYIVQVREHFSVYTSDTQYNAWDNTRAQEGGEPAADESVSMDRHHHR